MNWKATNDLDLSFVVTNLANKMPDMDARNPAYGNNGAPYNSSMFDVYGRGYYLEARWGFGKKK